MSQRLWATGGGVPYPAFGLTSLLDFAPFQLPGALADTYAVPEHFDARWRRPIERPQISSLQRLWQRARHSAPISDRRSPRPYETASALDFELT